MLDKVRFLFNISNRFCNNTYSGVIANFFPQHRQMAPTSSYYGNSSVSPVSVSGFYWKTERDVYNVNIDISELHNIIIVSVTFEEQDEYFKSVLVLFFHIIWRASKLKSICCQLSWFRCLFVFHSNWCNFKPCCLRTASINEFASLCFPQADKGTCFATLNSFYPTLSTSVVKTGSGGLKVSLDSGSANKQNRKHGWGGGWREFHNVELGNCVCL